MLVQYNDYLKILPLTVLFTSVLGSLHCTAMCGALVTTFTNSTKTWIAYQLGRLLGYTFLGGLAGYLGQVVFNHKTNSNLNFYAALISAVFISLFLIVSGIKTWNGQSLHFSVLPRSLLNRLFLISKKQSTVVGFLSSFLPCGWLHTFVIGAAATQSVFSGIIFMTFFWLGTLPALVAFPYIQKLLFFIKSPRLIGLLLIIVGSVGLGIKLKPIFLENPNVHTCHEN